ncbi:P-type conjugative transfer protein TrbG [Blastochloris sulfoviridis]|uniref:P-type conjugative transfer protein TrbG n=1 Tax=Blastochloris sulfoviridis TaxID=50712 RepID=A0A5M6I0T0_9HYPH|nr:P-type conjugative transfer protein TrbG [Blastochloris sulfoviridis]KAA5601776.1 P-type conjugative transfer protein TrbG [Blastochloris sulfoviridis]
MTAPHPYRAGAGLPAPRICAQPGLRNPGFTTFRNPVLPALLISALTLSACATNKPPQISYDDPQPAVLEVDPPAPVEVVELPTPLPLPGQLKPVAPSNRTPEPRDPTARVDKANAAARVQPVRDGFINAVQVYPFSSGALYQVYTAPGQITDIALQPGEQLVGSGPVAAGDTVRWIIGDTESATGAARQIHILVKPTRPDLTTNLVINTDRRTYHLELRSTASTYMASVSWQYPQDQLIALRRQNAAALAAAPVASSVDLSALNFRYAIEGDTPPWRPLRAFDDGRQVFIEFPRGIGQGEMPPLFVVGPEGNTSELVNYRVRGSHIIVDRLFAAAELRFGSERSQSRVRISRTDGRPAT